MAKIVLASRMTTWTPARWLLIPADMSRICGWLIETQSPLGPLSYRRVWLRGERALYRLEEAPLAEYTLVPLDTIYTLEGPNV